MRTETLTVRLDKKEKEILNKAAAKQSRAVSEFIRLAALKAAQAGERV